MIQTEPLQAYLQGCAARQRASGTHPPTPAIVLGLCKHGLYLTRNFARHGIPVLAIESNLAQSSAHTRYGHKLVCADLYGAPLIELLQELQPWVPASTPIFPTNDRMVEFLLSHYRELSGHYRLPFPEGDLLRRLVSKPELCQLATAAGLNVPRSFAIFGLESLQQARPQMRFPVVVKPALPMMSFKSRRCDDFETLAAQVEASARINEPLIVQEWIEGDDRTILFGAYYLSSTGACLASYSGRKLMSYPTLTGHAAATESCDLGQLLEQGANFLQSLGYWGLCSIEYKGHAPAEARFIEVTVGRADWWIMCCGINGVNIPLAAYNDLTGASLAFDNLQTSAYIWHDIEHSFPVLVENLRMRRWSIAEGARFLIRAKKEALWDPRDPLPFLHALPSYFLGCTAMLRRFIARALAKAG